MGATLVTLEGAGHGPHARQPVKVNVLIRDFACPPKPAAPWTTAMRRRKRALYISSPIGLGHAQRDVAIADELRRLHPDLEIDWLAQHPVTTVLQARGERIHPASAELASELHHIESESAEHDLHCFQAVRRMDEILLANFMVFHDLVHDQPYDLWIGDEAWDLDYYLHENPEEKRAAYVWLTDFVGWLPMPDGGDAESALTTDYNAEMIEQIARYPRVRDRAIFVGNSADIVPDTFGPGLPSIREWTGAHFDFAGYVTGFDPAQFADANGFVPSSGMDRTSGYASSPWEDPVSGSVCSARSSAPIRLPSSSCRTCAWSWSPGHGSIQQAFPLLRVWRFARMSMNSTATLRSATLQSCRAASRRAWSSQRAGGRSSTFRSVITSSRTSMCAIGCSGTARGAV